MRATLKRIIPAPMRRFLRWHQERFGAPATLRAALQLLARRGVARVRAPGGAPLWLRPGTADQNVYDEVFVRQDYAVDLDTADYIVDAGAHVGCATLFFSQRFPGARIIAIEPDGANFELLARNVAHLPNVVPVRGALWSRATRVSIRNPHKATWSYRVAESDVAASIPSYSVQDLLDRFEFPRIDLFKMDIEGSEVEVLQDAKGWIDRVGMMVVETHDRWREGCQAAVDAAARGENFVRRSAGGGVVTILQRPVRVT